MSTIFDRDVQVWAPLAENIRKAWPSDGTNPVAEEILDNVEGMLEEGWGTSMLDTAPHLNDKERHAFLEQFVRPLVETSGSAGTFLEDLEQIFVDRGFAKNPKNK